MYLVEDLYKAHGQVLTLKLVAGEKGLKKRIAVPEVERPGLILSGYFKSYVGKRVLIFGKVELEYLRDLDPKERARRLHAILSMPTPAIIVSSKCKPPKDLLALCETYQVPCFTSGLASMTLLSRLTLLLTDEFSPAVSCHGTLVEVFGVGVLIQGNSSVGKSEAALGLIERGHRLISDDIVKVQKREGGYLEGSGAEITRYHMEIRGIGIINVADLYGAVCVRDRKSIELVVTLELWDDTHFYDRLGIEEKYSNILGMNLPHHILPVTPGRDVVLLLETIALNHRLKKMGYHSAKNFQDKLTTAIASKTRRSL